MSDIFNLFLNNVASDELGKNWILFEIIAITLGCLPWIVLLLYVFIFRKYTITYYVDNQEVHREKYKKNQIINKYVYESNGIKINDWYLDKELTKKFTLNNMLSYNIKLFANSTKEEDNNE